MSRHSTARHHQQQQQQQQRVTKSSLLGASLLDLSAGDVFYRTVQRYPGLSDVDDDVCLLVTNAAAVDRERKRSPAVEWQGSVRINARRDVNDNKK